MTGPRRRNGARLGATAAPPPPRRVEPVAVPANGFPAALLSLSDSQLEILMAAADPLRPEARSQFLQAVAERLAGVVEIGDGVVSRCCRELVRLYFEPPDTVAVGRWGRDARAKSADAQQRWRAAQPPDGDA
jgi:hypothetical protein